jgi:Tat protein translocase TatB subunit
MNIFSNIGITELILILLLALLVVGPERLPELAQKLGTTLRDVRKAYENLTKDLGPELASLQESTRELRESVDSVRTIPTEVVQSVLDMSELQETVDDLKSVAGSVESMGDTLNTTKKTLSDPMGAAVDAAKGALNPTKPDETAEEQADESGEQEGATSSPSTAASPDPEGEVEPTIAPPPDSESAEQDSPAQVDSDPKGTEDTDQGDSEPEEAPENRSAEESTND